MLRSLVGSEMCIRDRLNPTHSHYRQKTAIGQFSPKFSVAPGAKTVSQIRKIRGSKWDRGQASSIQMQSLVEIGGRTATGDEKQCCFLFVCLYVCHAGVQERGPDVQQRIMSPFVEQFQCGFQCFSQKGTSFLSICREFNYITRWRHNVRRNRRKF